MDIAGHVSKQMLKHYSHIRMEAKRNALEAILRKQNGSGESGQQTTCVEESPQKSPQSGIFEGHRGVYGSRKSMKRIGSSGRTRTYNPSVNSRMLCH